MVIVAASRWYEIDAKGSPFFMFSPWGGEGRKGTFLKMKIITAILKLPDY